MAKTQNATHISVRATYVEKNGESKTFDLPRISLKMAGTMGGALLGVALKGMGGEQQKLVIAGLKRMLGVLREYEPYTVVDLKDESSHTTALVKTLGDTDTAAPNPSADPAAPRWFTLTVENPARGLDAMVKLPLELAELGLKMLPLFGDELGDVLSGIDLAPVFEAIAEKRPGTALETKTGSGERIKAVIQ